MLQVECGLKVESAWFQLLKLKYDEHLSNFAFNGCNVRPYSMAKYGALARGDTNMYLRFPPVSLWVPQSLPELPAWSFWPSYPGYPTQGVWVHWRV